MEDWDVIVVGAGFAGLYQLYHLRKLGYKVKAVEKASGLGGVWFWQTYPGARVDSEVPSYGYSLEEVWKEWNYTERFPARNEIIKYFEHVDKKLDLSKDIHFNTFVVNAEFDNTLNKWKVYTERGKVYSARFLSMCVGFSAKPYEAPFKGMGEYKGVVHHSNDWPKEVSLRGKRVAVIGTGASGVQIIQELGPQVSQLTVFQRTPNLALPMNNPPLGVAEQIRDKSKYPELFDSRLNTFGGFLYTSGSKKTFDDNPEARQAFFEELWALGDMHFWIGGYKDTLTNEEANMAAYDFWCKKVRARVHKLEMRDKLAPLIPPHAFGTKRPSLEKTYFEVFNQPNVDLVDLKSIPIECFTPTGIRTTDGVHREFDAVALATGFDAVTGAVLQINIKGSTGITLKEKWARGTTTYLGVASVGFPNLFFTYGPQAPAVFSNGLTCAEAQGTWLVKLLDHALKSGKTRVEATEQAEAKWSKHANDIFNATLFAQTESYYTGANIPGKVKEALCYYGGLPKYIRECKRVEENGYEGFIIHTPSRL